MYELFTGMKPVQGDTVEKLFHQVLYDAPNLEPLHEAQVPPAAIDLIRKCLAKAPAERPPGFGIICGALEEILGPGAIRLRAVPQPALPPSPAADAGELPAFLRKLPAPLRTQGGLMLVAGVATLVVIVLVYFVFARRL